MPKITGRQPTPVGRPEAGAAEPKRGPTLRDVPHSQELATRYGLDTSNLPFLTSEEVVEYVHHNLAALEKGGKLDGRALRRIEANIHFGLDELEKRLPRGSKLRESLYAARQAASSDTEEGPIPAAAVKQARTALTSFIAERKISDKAAGWDPAVFTPAHEVTRFRRMIDGLSWGLGRAINVGIDPPNFRQELPNPLPQMGEAVRELRVPKEGPARQAFTRAIDEISAALAELGRTAEGVSRPDIAASAREVIALLAARRDSAE